MKNTILSRFTFILFLGIGMISIRLQAEGQPPGGLRFDYWTYGMNGIGIVEGSEANVDSTNKVLKGENWGVVFGGDVRLDRWGVLLDLMVTGQSVSQQISSSERVDWTSKLNALTVGAFYPFWENGEPEENHYFEFDGTAGLRCYTNIYKINFLPYDSTNNRDRGDTVSWIDPYVGLRFQAKFNPHWAVALYGDAGGYGIGNASELSVLSRADLIWMVTPNFNFIGGYRLFDLKTANEKGSQKTQLDARMAGPTVGMEVRFQ